MIAAIPTRYKGVQMRSRLEARWAAFFDLLGWEWHYEPFDLKGWIPDFALGSDLTTAALVEIKPIDWPSEPQWNTQIDFGEYIEEIRQAVCQIPFSSRGLLVCGLRPWWLRPETYGAHSWRIGPIYERKLQRWNHTCAKENEKTGIDDFPIGDRRPYIGFVTGTDYTSGGPPEISDFPCDDKARKRWIEAGNRVQWRAPR